MTRNTCDGEPVEIGRALKNLDGIVSANEKPVPAPSDDRAWRARGIPDEFFDADRAKVAGSLPTVPGNVLLFGANGVGKSYAAAVLAKEWGGWWCDMFSLPSRVQASKSFAAGETSERIREWLGGPYVMVLDDLWAIATNPVGLEWILVALNARRKRGYSTIVTAHQPLAEIEKVSSHVASRLAAFEPVKLSGADRRLRR